MFRLALLLMLLTSSLWVLNARGESVFFIVAVVFGITHGLCIALLPSVIADNFGSKEISGIIGAIYTSFALAALLGPTTAGLLRDRFGNYDQALGLCVLLSLSTVVVSAGIEKRYWGMIRKSPPRTWGGMGIGFWKGGFFVRSPGRR